MTKSILLVENEPLIAMDLEVMLRSAGYADIGHVVSVEQAFEWLGTQSPAAVILDLMVRDGKTTPVARHLHASGTPFLVYSGLERAEVQYDVVFDDAIWLSKPCTQSDLVLAIEQALRLSPR